MPQNKGGGILTEASKRKFQARLALFFRDHRYRHHLEPKDVAKKLGYKSVSRYNSLESENIPYPRFVTSIDFLASIAALESMPVGEFVQYLEGKEPGDEPANVGRKLTNWEKTLLATFNPIDISIRKKFTEICKKITDSNSRKHLEVVIEIASILLKKDPKAVASLRDSLKGL